MGRPTDAKQICGTTSHFSEFALMEPDGSVAVGDAPIPTGLMLRACVPNPAHGGSSVPFALPHAAYVRLALYDAGGRRVRELLHGALPAGDHAVRWDGRDASGRRVGSGLYLVRLEMEGVTLTGKLIEMR